MNKELFQLFDIKDDDVEFFTVDNKELNYEINIRFKPSRKYYPICGSIHFINKGNKKRLLVSAPINDKPVKMITHVKRYKCLDCDFSFSDINPVSYDDWSFTRTAIISILNKLKPYNATYASIARMYGVSSTRIMGIFDTFARIKRHTLPRVLLIDEFHFSRNAKYKYRSILMNFENNLIVDIVKLRTHDTRIMRKYAQNKKSLEYRLLKHRYKILLKSENDVDRGVFKYDKLLEYYITGNMILKSLLSFDDDLKQAYNAKKEHLIFDQVTKEEVNNSDKRKEFNNVIKRFRHTKVAKTLSNQKEEILNSFIWINNRRISNEPVEGKNNYIKKILSNTNGMTKFHRAKNRILYFQNKYKHIL